MKVASRVLLYVVASGGKNAVRFHSDVLFEPDTPVSVTTIPTTTVTGWQLSGIPILLVAVAIAVCGYLFIRRHAGLRTKIVLVGVVLIYGLIVTIETNSVISRLAQSRAIFGPSITEGSGPGMGTILDGVAVVALIFGTVLAIGWIPGYLEIPPSVWKQSHDS